MSAQIDKSKRTGLFGGTFDPVHIGHVNIVRQVLAHTALTQILVMPAATPPHKQHRTITSGNHRLAILRLAFAGEPDVIVSDFELVREGVSFTVTTAAELQADLAQPLYLIIGMDSLCELHTWVEAQRLVSTYPIVVYGRPGESPPDWDALCGRFGEDAAKKLTASILTAPELDVSSSVLRSGLQENDEAARKLLPDAVYEYIRDNELYRQMGNG